MSGYYGSGQLIEIQPLQQGSAAYAVNIILNDVSLEYSLTTFTPQVYGFRAINNMISNILLTVPGERHYEPLFGSILPYLLFQPMDAITAWQMETATYDALKFWMPYISFNAAASSIVPNYDEQLYQVVLAYTETISNQPGIYSEQIQRGGVAQS
jgi:phage baseplate assembly protein W